MFSSRLPPLAPNALSQALADARRFGAPLLDLTESNPTAVGLPYPPGVLSALASDEGLSYRPDPRGLVVARRAVADEYAAAGVRVDAASVVLASGTSESYSALFKLLCDPGDEVLVPVPSYPLFELLTALDGVVSRPYRLDPSGHWCLDRASIETGLTDRTRAVLVVSPNNPTGSILSREDRDWLVGYCSDRGVAVVADEVFGAYRLAPRRDASSLAGVDGALVFTLGGLSKLAGLPQAKLAWTLVSGPASVVGGALERLDLIGDTYLSVSTPVQLAAASLLAAGRTIRDAIRQRLERNLDELRRRVAAVPAVTLHEPEGGWSAVLRVPAVEPEETLVLRLMRQQHVLVHPGYFFDFAEEAFLIVSLLPRPELFDEGVDRLLDGLREGR